MKRNLIILILFFNTLIFNGLSGQVNSIGIYTGPVFVLQNDAVTHPENYFAHGLSYNQKIFFDLSLQATLGISRQPFINPDWLSPGNVTYPWLDGGLYLRYWPLNDIRGLLSRQRENIHIQSEIVTLPFNFYFFGGGDCHLILNNTDAGVEDRVLNISGGIGFQYNLAPMRNVKGFIPFAEVMYIKNQTPYYKLNTVSYSFQFIAVKAGIRYSFMDEWRNSFCK